MIGVIKNFEYSKVSSFANKLLILLIICFAFFISFHPTIDKKIIANMSYIWLLSLNFKNLIYYIKNNKIFLFLIILFIYITVTIVITPVNALHNYSDFCRYFLLPILIIATTIKKEHIKYIVSAFLFGMFINELISYGIYFELINGSFLGFKITGNSYNPIPFVASHMEYTLLLSFTIIASLFTLTITKNRFLQILLCLFTITMSINLFLTTGRTGQFTLLTTIVCLLIIYFRHNIEYIILGFITLIIVFVLAFNFSSNTNTRLKQGFFDIVKVIEDKNYNTSFGVRLTSYVLLPDIIKSEQFSILYGFGYSNVDDKVQEIQIKEIGEFMEVHEGHLHNTYITIFAATGFIGIILFLIFWYYLFALKIEDRYVNYIRYSYFFVVSFGGICENMFRQREIMLFSAVFIAIIICITTKNNKVRINE